MKKRILSFSILALAGCMLLASCKHGGLPVKGGAVQVKLTFAGESMEAGIPIKLYDVLAENLEKLANQFNNNETVSEEEIEAYNDFKNRVYNLDLYEADKFPKKAMANLVTVLTPEDSEQVLKYIKKQDLKTMGYLTGMLEVYTSFYDMPLQVFKELNAQAKGEGYFDTPEELFEVLKTDESYELFYTLVEQFFPTITFEKK